VRFAVARVVSAVCQYWSTADRLHLNGSTTGEPVALKCAFQLSAETVYSSASTWTSFPIAVSLG